MWKISALVVRLCVKVEMFDERKDETFNDMVDWEKGFVFLSISHFVKQEETFSENTRLRLEADTKIVRTFFLCMNGIGKTSELYRKVDINFGITIISSGAAGTSPLLKLLKHNKIYHCTNKNKV